MLKQRLRVRLNGLKIVSKKRITLFKIHSGPKREWPKSERTVHTLGKILMLNEFLKDGRKVWGRIT